MTDSTVSAAAPADPPEYPDTAIGALARQRDAKLAEAQQKRGMAEVFESQADAAELSAQQMQAAIDAMPPDPS